MRALAIAATGMSAQQQNIEVISHNIANINTVGYKRAETAFSSLVAGQTDDGGRTGGVTTVTERISRPAAHSLNARASSRVRWASRHAVHTACKSALDVPA